MSAKSCNERRRTGAGACARLAAAAILFAAGGAQAETLRFGVTIPERTLTVREAMAPWAREVSERAGGDLTVELYPGGSLGRNGKLQYWLLKQGVIDIAWILPSDTPGRFPATDFFEIPVKSDDPLEVSLAFWRLYEQGYLTGFDEVKPLALYVSPPYRLHLRTPYTDASSLYGKKIRAVTHLQAKMLEAAGATPVGGVTTTQVAENLSRGLIDGALFSWHGVKAVGVLRAASVHVDQAITFAPAMIAINRKVYDGLSPKARAAIDELSGEPLVRRLVESMNCAAKIALDEASSDESRQFVAANADDAAVWRQRFERAADDWRSESDDNERVAAAFEAILDEIMREEAGAPER
jgi:TRAP-type C4-dicarboxylate transport system substrate-binding protein